MNINERFNKARAKKLRIEGLKENSFVEYCPNCNFQLHTDVKSLKFCPACRTPLVGVVLTEEMIELINGD